MAAQVYPIKQHDLEPAFEVVLWGTYNDVEQVIPLGLAESVWLYLAKRGEPTQEHEMNILDAPNGRVSYAWQSGDTDIPGDWKGEIEIRWGGGVRPQTIPADAKENFIVRISPDEGP